METARKAVTSAAKSAVKTAIKYTPIPALVAAAKPLIKSAGKIIESAAKLAPALVAMTVTAVTDPSKFAATLYNKAVEQVGPLVESISKAAEAVGQFVQEHSDAIIEGLALVGGIAAGLACSVATAGIGTLGCLVGAAAIINLGKDAAEGNINSFGDAFKSAGIGAGQGLLGAGAGAVGGKVAGALVARLGSAAGTVGARVLGGGVAGGVSDAAYQFGSTGRVDLGGVATGAALGAVTGGFARGGCGRNSFAGNTGVLMSDGSTKAISLVRVGDTVKAIDPSTEHPGDEAEEHVVTDVIVGTGEKHLVEVTVNTTGGPQKIVATDEHPFWVASLNTWVTAKDLHPGYRFETTDHRPATVHTTRAWTEHTTVYNLTIDTLHTYYVLAGRTPVLVHNCGGSTNSHLSDLPVHPDINKFNVRAGELVNNRFETHALNPHQMNGGEVAGHRGVRNLTNNELIMPGGPQGNDPIRGARDWGPGDCGCYPASRVYITGGHHRTAEIARRVNAGDMSPDTLIEFVISPP